MSRLIDADNLEEAIKEYFKKHITDNSCMVDCVDCSADIYRIVEEQQTAFDVEKVLNELKHEESKAFRRYSESKGTAYAFSDKCSCDNWAKAIEIVKRGGADEKNQ